MTEATSKNTPTAGLGAALIPLAALILFIGGNAWIHGEAEWAPHIPLVLAAAVAGLVGVFIGVAWKDIEEGIVDGISAPGLSVDLRAEMDVEVVVSNCPQINNPCNGFNPTPVRMIVTA